MVSPEAYCLVTLFWDIRGCDWMRRGVRFSRTQTYACLQKNKTGRKKNKQNKTKQKNLNNWKQKLWTVKRKNLSFYLLLTHCCLFFQIWKCLVVIGTVKAFVLFSHLQYTICCLRQRDEGTTASGYFLWSKYCSVHLRCKTVRFALSPL